MLKLLLRRLIQAQPLKRHEIYNLNSARLMIWKLYDVKSFFIYLVSAGTFRRDWSTILNTDHSLTYGVLLIISKQTLIGIQVVCLSLLWLVTIALSCVFEWFSSLCAEWKLIFTRISVGVKAISIFLRIIDLNWNDLIVPKNNSECRFSLKKINKLVGSQHEDDYR